MTTTSIKPKPAALAQRWRQLKQAPERGEVTEMVLALPIWVMLLMLVVLCGRLVTAQIDVDAAAHNAARAASLARTPGAAERDAINAATQTLADRQVTCADLVVEVSHNNLQPGVPVRVDVRCTANLSDLGLLGVPGTRDVESSSTSPVDQWRGEVTP